MAEKRIIAKFHPQAWVNDYAVDVDPQGPVEFDVTHAILKMGKKKALEIADDSYESDNLRSLDGNPGWIVDWDGPFYVEVQQAINDYFD